jgi:hypothetical protein
MEAADILEQKMLEASDLVAIVFARLDSAAVCRILDSSYHLVGALIVATMKCSATQ